MISPILFFIKSFSIDLFNYLVRFAQIDNILLSLTKMHSPIVFHYGGIILGDLHDIGAIFERNIIKFLFFLLPDVEHLSAHITIIGQKVFDAIQTFVYFLDRMSRHIVLLLDCVIY